MSEGPPDVSAVRDEVVAELSRLVRGLRAEGVAVPADGTLVAGRALATVGLDDERRVHTTLQAVLLSDPDDIARFEPMFEHFWERLRAILRGESPPSGSGEAAERPSEVFAPLGGDAGGHGPSPSRRDATEPGEVSTATPHTRRVGREGSGEAVQVSEGALSGASPVGLPEPVSLADGLLPAANSLEKSVDVLGAALAKLRGRRWERGAGRPDVRRALRKGVATGGIPAALPERARARRAVRATVLVDVSRSVLDTLDRGYLVAVLRAIAARWRDAHVFLFDTDLREVTDAVETRAPTDALAAMERAELEWGGGTEIGAAFRTLRDQHPDAVDRRTAVLVISDGLETGELDDLAAGAAWLSRRAATVLWLNPLAADPEYEPTVRGMQTVGPYVDGVFAFAGPGDVAEIARQVERRGTGGPIGYEYDPRRTRGA